MMQKFLLRALKNGQKVKVVHHSFLPERPQRPSTPTRERAAESSGGARPPVTEPRPLTQPTESQLQPIQRPLGLPESGGGEVGMPRPRDLPEPDVTPDAQSGTGQPGVAVSSQVVAEPQTLLGVGIAQPIREQGTSLPSAYPQTTVNALVGFGN